MSQPQPPKTVGPFIGHLALWSVIHALLMYGVVLVPWVFRAGYARSFETFSDAPAWLIVIGYFALAYTIPFIFMCLFLNLAGLSYVRNWSLGVKLLFIVGLGTVLGAYFGFNSFDFVQHWVLLAILVPLQLFFYLRKLAKQQAEPGLPVSGGTDAESAPPDDGVSGS